MTLVQIDRKSVFSLDKKSTERFFRIQKDYEWILNNKQKLTEQYPDKYIAVENKVVRFIGANVEDLMNKISMNHEQVDNFAVEFLSPRQKSFLF